MRLMVFVGGLLALAAAFLAINYVTAPSLNQYTQRTSVAAERDCGKEPGFLGGPLVANAETAQGVFEAVALGLRGPAFMAKYTNSCEGRGDRVGCLSISAPGARRLQRFDERELHHCHQRRWRPVHANQ